MTADRSCPRAWEAEAIEDGQLAGADRASFERHAATCETCTRQIEGLASLRRTMTACSRRARTPLELRRMRTTLLHRAHQVRTAALPRPSRASAGRRVAAAAAVLMVLGLAVWVGWRRAGEPGQPSPVAATGVTFDVTGAVVTSTSSAGVTRATLSDGTAAFRVDHVAPRLRFLLTLPDGEIEVRGTRFSVKVHDARTESVEVTEGLVALRLRGEGERSIGGGERWARAKPAESTSADADVPPANTSSAAPPLRRPASRDARTVPASPPAADVAKTSTSSGRDVSPERVAAKERFAAAMAAFHAGSYARADALFDSFDRDFPGDARREDAAFLRAVCHARMGDGAGSESLARAYLREFPNGLRRPEATQLVEGR